MSTIKSNITPPASSAVTTHLQENNVNLGVLHAAHQDGDQLGQVWLECFLADWVLGQRQPKLTRLQGHVLIGVLREESQLRWWLTWCGGMMFGNCRGK